MGTDVNPWVPPALAPQQGEPSRTARRSMARSTESPDRHTSRRYVVAAVIVSAGLTGLSGTGCGPLGDDVSATPSQSGGSTISGPSASSRVNRTPEPSKVDFTSPSAVCNAFADTLFSGSPTREKQTDPLERAGRYVTDDYRKTFFQQAPRLAYWSDWAKAGVTQLRHTSIANVGEELNEGTRKRQYRVASRRVVPLDSHGSPLGQTYGFVVYCTLVDERGRWLVGNHSQGSIDPSQ